MQRPRTEEKHREGRRWREDVQMLRFTLHFSDTPYRAACPSLLQHAIRTNNRSQTTRCRASSSDLRSLRCGRAHGLRCYRMDTRVSPAFSRAGEGRRADASGVVMTRSGSFSAVSITRTHKEAFRSGPVCAFGTLAACAARSGMEGTRQGSKPGRPSSHRVENGA